MLYTQTLEKLRALRLEGMVQGLDEQRRQSDITQLDFEARLALLVERQWLWRENRGLAARLKYAQLKISDATLEGIDYHHCRGLKRAQIDQLRASRWIEEKRNCLITGPTGVGIMPGTGSCRAVGGLPRNHGPEQLSARHNPRRSYKFWRN